MKVSLQTSSKMSSHASAETSSPTPSPETIEQLNAELQAMLASSATSRWLKGALRDSFARDCVDAAMDADKLSEMLTRRVEATFSADGACSAITSFESLE